MSEGFVTSGDKVFRAIEEMCFKDEGGERVETEWKQVFDNAPGNARLRLAVAFYATKNMKEMTDAEKDEYRLFRDKLESQLNEQEIRYIIDQFSRMGVGNEKIQHYQELLAKVKGNGNDVAAANGNGQEG